MQDEIKDLFRGHGVEPGPSFIFPLLMIVSSSFIFYFLTRSADAALTAGAFFTFGITTVSDLQSHGNGDRAEYDINDMMRIAIAEFMGFAAGIFIVMYAGFDMLQQRAYWINFFRGHVFQGAIGYAPGFNTAQINNLFLHNSLVGGLVFICAFIGILTPAVIVNAGVFAAVLVAIFKSGQYPALIKILPHALIEFTALMIFFYSGLRAHDLDPENFKKWAPLLVAAFVLMFTAAVIEGALSMNILIGGS